MRGAFTLALHSLHRMRTIVVALLALVCGFEILLVVAAHELQRSGSFTTFASMVPPFVRQLFGDSMLVLMSYSGLVGFGYFHPMVMAALIGLVIAVATEPAAEIETRFLDLALARPVPRRSVVLRTAALVVLLPAFLITCMLAATLVSLRVALPATSVGPRPAMLLGLAVNLWAVVFCAGAITLALAVMCRRRTVPAGAASVLMLATFFLDYLARIWKPAARVSWLSPFHYYDAMGMVMGKGLAPRDIATLAIVGIIAFAIAFVRFERRNL